MTFKSRHYESVINLPIGKLGIQLDEQRLPILNFLPNQTPLKQSTDPLVIEIIQELKCYFENPHYSFKKKIKLKGSLFQQKVWRALAQIPVGKTLTYGELAKKLKTSPRAIGQACRTNRIPILIPCHRIVAASHLGGFAGATSGKLMEVKTLLLKYEAYGL